MPGLVAKHVGGCSEETARMLMDDFLRIMAETTYTQPEGQLPIVQLEDIEQYMECDCQRHLSETDETDDRKVFMDLDDTSTSRCPSAAVGDDRQQYSPRPPDLFACLGAYSSAPYEETTSPAIIGDESMNTWASRPPSTWDQKEVGDWLYCTAAQYDLDGVIRGEAFRDICGQALCAMTAEDFSVLGGESGAILYGAFVILRSKYPADIDNQTSHSFTNHCEKLPSEDRHLPEHGGHSATAPPTGTPVKRGRGRPRKRPLPPPTGQHNPPKQRGRKKGQRSRGHHLWEFLRDLLNNPEQNPLVIRWEDQENGVFRIIDSTKVAKLWGDQKRNQKMTYEKLSRAIRFCQNESVGYFSKLPEQSEYPKKLCFMFGPKTSGWK